MEELDNNIHIGELERIHWIDFDSSSKDLFDVDYILNKYQNFWVNLEIFCLKDCCGLDAFRFYPNDIIKASTEVNKISLKEDLTRLKTDLINSEKSIIISSDLNNLVDKTVFIKLLDHINKNL